ncbi:amidohydrolase family protein [Streptomyces sp. DSM 44917]|uniref:Amidohydrolase family protein n=1 Tax=Streptomyces boetiae TaxID=3075541 RepID=A0ABU2L879_9ACTN|nr:amidohydrolase family protein [Streptomyces sp. DSM 44917]MDT0307552.1 amidohydrolase family protein [Streptomyces sp. DSM 44917]
MVDCETHYLTQGFLDLLRGRDTPPRQEVDGALRHTYFEPTAPRVVATFPDLIERQLLELGDARIALMDEHGIGAQVVSLTAPGTEGLPAKEGLAQARLANDALGAALARHPGRLIGLATLAPLAGEESARELERCVNELGFRGANIHSHVGDRYLDDPACRPVFEAAEALGVPVNIHPTLPLGAMLEPYLGYGWTLPGPGLGFGHEVAVQVSRMIFAGVFDAFPRLQIMLGHCGEALPFWMYRLDFPYVKSYLAGHPKLQRKPSEYLADNFWYNCSGQFFGPAFLTCLQAVGADRMLFGSDHPYESYAEAVAFAERMPVFSQRDREKILHRNAQRLFGLA